MRIHRRYSQEELWISFTAARKAGTLSTIASQYQAVASDHGFRNITFEPKVVEKHVRPMLVGEHTPLFALAHPYHFIGLFERLIRARLPQPFPSRLDGVIWAMPLALAGDPHADQMFRELLPSGHQLLNWRRGCPERVPVNRMRFSRKEMGDFNSAAASRLVFPRLEESQSAYFCAVLRRGHARELAKWLHEHSTTHAGPGGEIRVIDLNDQDSLPAQQQAHRLVWDFDDAGAELARLIRSEEMLPAMRDFVVVTDFLYGERPAETARTLRAMGLVGRKPDTSDIGAQASAERIVRDRRLDLGLPSWRDAGVATG